MSAQFDIDVLDNMENMSKKINSKPVETNKSVNITKTTHNINININNNINLNGKKESYDLFSNNKDLKGKSLEIVNSKSVPDNIFIKEIRDNSLNNHNLTENNTFHNTESKLNTNKSINE